MATHALGRHLNPAHDPRSKAYPAKVAYLVSVRHRHHGPVLDQGRLGSCTGNAAAQALNHEPLLDIGPAGHPRRILYEADAVAIYSWATHHDPFPGAYPPVDTGSDGLSVAKALRRLRLIRSYRHAFGLDHTLGALALAPVIIGIPWHEAMFTPTIEHQLKPEGPIVGGHEVCLNQLDVENQRVWLLNSWGDGWGHAGRAWLTYNALAKLLAQHGDATILRP